MLIRSIGSRSADTSEGVTGGGVEAIDEAEGGEGDRVGGGDGDIDRDEDKGAEEEKAAAAVVAADDGGGVDLLVGRKDELISPIPKKKSSVKKPNNDRLN